tara:strand:+ start:1474 stop:2073 length:600 start_codon:yes stop_codon:yes gene_type:complete
MRRIVGIDVGLHNLALCSVQYDAASFLGIESWQVVDCAPGKNATKMSIADSCAAVVDTLDAMTFEDVQIFSIESQPCGRVATGNTKMKVVSHCIQTWARLRFPKSSVVFTNPKNKMAREYVGELLGLEGGDAAVKARYKKHKDAAVAAASKIVENDETWSAFLSGLKKKDDAADALLLACVAGKPPKKKKSRKRKQRDE